jgi:hypothetical protein
LKHASGMHKPIHKVPTAVKKKGQKEERPKVVKTKFSKS